MLKSEEIISGLQTIVRDYSILSIVWHVVFYIFTAALIVQWKPSNQMVALFICLPALSVGILAWLTGNPFNGTLFVILAILILIFGLKASNQPVLLSNLPFALTGIGMIIFGLVYPHFIEPNSVFSYLYASPAGLIPCPTLSVLIGFVLLFNGFGSQTITITLIIFGLFYGVFGILKLGVYLDLFLVFGTLALLTKYLLSFRSIGT